MFSAKFNTFSKHFSKLFFIFSRLKLWRQKQKMECYLHLKGFQKQKIGLELTPIFVTNQLGQNSYYFFQIYQLKPSPYFQTSKLVLRFQHFSTLYTFPDSVRILMVFFRELNHFLNYQVHHRFHETLHYWYSWYSTRAIAASNSTKLTICNNSLF